MCSAASAASSSLKSMIPRLTAGVGGPPSGPRAVHHAAAVGLNGKIYLIGGYVDGWMPTDEVHEYDPAADSWRARARMPTPRARSQPRRSTAKFML